MYNYSINTILQLWGNKCLHRPPKNKGFGFYMVPFSCSPTSTNFTQQNLCCISNSVMKHMQKPDSKPDLPCFSYDYWRCMFVDFLIEYICLPNVFTIECRVANNIWRSNPISFRHMSYDVCSLILTEHIPIKYRSSIKKSKRLTPAYLSRYHSLTTVEKPKQISIMRGPSCSIVKWHLEPSFTPFDAKMENINKCNDPWSLDAKT